MDDTESILSSSEINMNEINSIKSNNIMADEVDNLFDDSLEDVIQTPEKDIDLFSLIEKQAMQCNL